jgi:hypothetical protein
VGGELLFSCKQDSCPCKVREFQVSRLIGLSVAKISFFTGMLLACILGCSGVKWFGMPSYFFQQTTLIVAAHNLILVLHLILEACHCCMKHHLHVFNASITIAEDIVHYLVLSD